MDVIIYVLIICLMIYLVVSLLPVILPIVIGAILVFSLFLWYAKRKIKKQMEAFDNDWEDGFHSFDSYDQNENQSTLDSDDIIDVEFTEREDDDQA